MRRRLLAASAALVLAGCASTSEVTLLPDEGATTSGSVAVLDTKTEAERGALTEANTQARVGGRSVKPKAAKRGPFYNLFAAFVPAAPRSYVMYFTEGTTDLDEASKPILQALRAVVTESSEVQITGHTDTVGAEEFNDKLSLERAAEIRAELVKQGLPVANARIVGRGERELRVATGDEVNEAANRRVEVILR